MFASHPLVFIHTDMQAAKLEYHVTPAKKGNENGNWTL